MMYENNLGPQPFLSPDLPPREDSEQETLEEPLTSTAIPAGPLVGKRNESSSKGLLEDVTEKQPL